MVDFDHPTVLAALYKRKSVLDSDLPSIIAPCFMIKVNNGAQIIPANHSEIINNFNKKMKVSLKSNYNREMKRKLKVIHLSPDACDCYYQFKNHIRAVIGNMQWKHMHHFLKRVPGLAIRLAGAIHAWQYDAPEEVPLSGIDMQLGSELALTICNHADYVFKPAGLGARENAEKILEWIKRHNIANFTSRDIQQQVTGMHSKDDIFPALDYLATKNYIDQLVLPGRSRQCVVHPSILQCSWKL